MKTIFTKTKQNLLLSLFIMFIHGATSAQTIKFYSCQALDGNKPGLGGMSSGASIKEAQNNFLEFMKQHEVNKISCLAIPKLGSLNDLLGKKWKSFYNETYLVFQSNRLLHIQECGNARRIQRYNTETIGELSLQLTEAGSEGTCNPLYRLRLEKDSIIFIKVLIYEDQPSLLYIEEKRTGNESVTLSIFEEIK